MNQIKIDHYQELLNFAKINSFNRTQTRVLCELFQVIGLKLRLRLRLGLELGLELRLRLGLGLRLGFGLELTNLSHKRKF